MKYHTASMHDSVSRVSSKSQLNYSYSCHYKPSVFYIMKAYGNKRLSGIKKKTYMFIYSIYVCVCVCICIYMDRERKKDIHITVQTGLRYFFNVFESGLSYEIILYYIIYFLLLLFIIILFVCINFRVVIDLFVWTSRKRIFITTDTPERERWLCSYIYRNIKNPSQFASVQ